ncbi:MAG: hypothetical protein ACREL5_02945 [Gemmatimonadales bacterium]
MRPATVRVTCVSALLLLAACGDARLDKLTLGISSDSASVLIGDKPHTTTSYLTAGKQWEIQFYARSGANPIDSIPWRKMSPVVFINHKAVGWGWSWWGTEARKQHIDMPAK